MDVGDLAAEQGRLGDGKAVVKVYRETDLRAHGLADFSDPVGGMFERFHRFIDVGLIADRSLVGHPDHKAQIAPTSLGELYGASYARWTDQSFSRGREAGNVVATSAAK